MHYPALHAAVLATALTAVSVSATLSKPALRANMDAFRPVLQTNLKNKSVKIAQWAGAISSGCRDLANREGLDPADITTYQVTYSDCSVPWLLCRHKDAAASINTLVTNFGKVPVRMRQWTKEVLLRPDTSNHAYAVGNQIVLFNNPDNVALYIHEVTHTVDFGSGFQVDGLLSSSSKWLNAYNADSAVPDNYARTNQIENVAQFSQFVLTNRYVPGGAASLEPHLSRISHQLSTIASQGDNGDYSGKIYDQSLTCTVRYPNSSPVSSKKNKSKRSTVVIGGGATIRESAVDDDDDDVDGKRLSRRMGMSMEQQVKLFANAGVRMLDEKVQFEGKVMEATNCTTI